jgi:hypothetical protein
MVEKQEAQFWPGSKRYKIRYGPFDIPAWNNASATLKHTDEGGILTTNVVRPVMPCFDCLVTYSFFDLEDENGQVATDTSGAWLHHAVCYSRQYLLQYLTILRLCSQLALTREISNATSLAMKSSLEVCQVV